LRNGRDSQGIGDAGQHGKKQQHEYGWFDVISH
jgi:hypothetical protein